MSWIGILSGHLRKSKLAPLLLRLRAGSLVADVGVWCAIPEPNPSDNWLEKQEPGRGKLIAVGLDDMRAFRLKYPRALCVQADGCALPLRARAVDAAVANAVLEHVPTARQHDVVSELIRISRGQAMISVPDRFCPFEVHTRLPLVHWLPWWRGIMRLLGKRYWADSRHLTSLFSGKSLHSLLDRVTMGRGRWYIARQTLMLIPVSLVATYSEDGSGELSPSKPR